MSSFVETKALEQLTKSPVEFVEYPSRSVWIIEKISVQIFSFFLKLSRVKKYININVNL